MEALVNSITTPFPSRLFQIKPPLPKPRRELRCSRKNENGTGLFSETSQKELEGHNADMLQESFVSTDSGVGMNQSDIWKLFNDAQRSKALEKVYSKVFKYLHGVWSRKLNDLQPEDVYRNLTPWTLNAYYILYLNKQRLLAIEELNKAQKENNLLLARIEQLEAGEKASSIKGDLLLSDLITKRDSLSVCCELLLRIDSMVISGLIGTQEASDLRRMVVNDKVGIIDVFSNIEGKKDTELLSQLRQFSDKSKRKGFHIVHICTEMAPVVSVGSLASYVTGLSRVLQRKGNLVEVILPKYSSLDLGKVQAFREVKAEVHSYFSNHWHGNRIWTGVVCGIGVTFIEPLHHSSFFNRDRIYGYPDDFERFSYFSRASLDYIVKSGKQPDVLHIHNWQTAIIGPLFWDMFVNQGLGGTRILFSCHGFSSQCLEHPDKLALCGLDPPRLHRPDRLQDNIKTHLVNVLKGGVVYSNKVMVVSAIHSKDRIISSFSHGLESTLAIHREKLLVTPYGFDDTVWDPSKDKFLPAKYSVDDINGKAVCKAALRKQLGFSGNGSSIVVGCIYSEVSDVDLENLRAAVWLALRKGAQFVFMGHSQIDSALESFQEEVKDENVRFVDKYNEALSHLVLAGSDIILCPSFHDPLLQVPLKAMKYGAAPVSITLNDEGFRHAVEHDFGSTNLSQYIISAFANVSLSQALDQIRNDPSRWIRKIKDGMSKDFSWDAECYDIHAAAYMSIKNL